MRGGELELMRLEVDLLGNRLELASSDARAATAGSKDSRNGQWAARTIPARLPSWRL